LRDLAASIAHIEIAHCECQAFAVGADFGVRDSIEELLELVARAIEMGAPRIKLKCAKGWDTNMLTAIRKRFPPPIVFHIDCNGGYDLEADYAFLSSLDQYELAMIEQPLCPTTGGNAGDLLDHAELAKILKTPICLDESLNSLQAAKRAVELKSGRIFNIKPGRCGGATVALQIMALAKENGIPCWIGGNGAPVACCSPLYQSDSCAIVVL
jgi:O-succinylbenzoate synthase